ncbi:MAG: glycosyltransferase [Dehalococcoidia bacterium]
MNVYISKLSLGLEKLGFSIDIFTKSHSECTDKIVNISSNIKLIHIDSVPENVPKENLYEYIEPFKIQLINYIKDNKLTYDIIHSHYWLSALIGIDLSRHLDIKNVVTFHTLAEIKNQTYGQEKESILRSNKEKEIVINTNSIIVSTFHELEVLIQYHEANSSKVNVIPPGVDLSLFNPLSMSKSIKQLGLDKHPIILYVGRIDPIKGLPVLIEAMKYLKGDNHPKLLIIGDNTTQNLTTKKALDLIIEYELNEHITFIGPVEQTLLPLYYNAASLCVIPSHYESFGLVALEAMACKTTVIGTKVPGLESIIEDHHNGVLVEVNSPIKLAAAIEELLSNNQLNLVLAENGYNKSTNMTWDSSALQISKVYRDLIP